MNEPVDSKSISEIKGKFEVLYKQGLLEVTPEERIKQLYNIQELIAVWSKNPSLKQVIKIFKALANKKRLIIFQLICNGIHCPCEIEHLLGLSQSTVSHHLNILSDAGIIQTKRQGKWTFVYTNAKGLSKDFLIQLFDEKELAFSEKKN